MKTVLHLLTDPELQFPKRLIEQTNTDWKIEVIDLTRNNVDYGEVLQKVFVADSVQVW